jgi:hypothetical protein
LRGKFAGEREGKLDSDHAKILLRKGNSKKRRNSPKICRRDSSLGTGYHSSDHLLRICCGIFTIDWKAGKFFLNVRGIPWLALISVV